MKPKNLEDLVARLDYIDIGISATHLNYINANNVLYTLDAVNEGASSWITPYAKPQLLYHDSSNDAIGRIVDYSIESNAIIDGEPKDYVKLISRITEKSAITKVLNGIYLTCSVGSHTTKVRCSICNQELTENGLCEHEKGSLVDGKRTYWIVDNITYTENSFVNNPADIYSRIISIDIGSGPTDYEKFLQEKEKILTAFFMEDDMKPKNLSTEDRKNLTDSVFCGPGKTFPAHDSAHVKAGLAFINSSNLEDSIKHKIVGALYRKGKRFDIEPTDAELVENSELLVFRMSDNFTDKEQSAISDLFDKSPDGDLPNISDKEDLGDDDGNDPKFTISDFDEIKKGKKDDILSFCDYLVSEHKVLSDNNLKLKDEEKTFKKKMSEQITILNSKEDEINKLLDSNAQLVVGHKKSIVNNILDFKNINENRDEEFKKYDSRKVDSLLDTLNDFRNDSENNIPRINDDTLKNEDESDEVSGKPIHHDDSHEESRIDRFFKHNIITED